jgi:hypothetical protein
VDSNQYFYFRVIRPELRSSSILTSCVFAIVIFLERLRMLADVAIFVDVPSFLLVVGKNISLF